MWSLLKSPDAERAHGAFQRSIMLPAVVDEEKEHAMYPDGVLRLRLPKLEAAKSKRMASTG